MPLAQLRGRAGAAVAPTATEIIAVDPAFGTDAGGETVRIHLTRVRSGATVTIGGNAATVTGGSYGVGSGKYLDVTTPAGTAGLVDVVVTDYHGTDTATGAFEYVAGGGLPADVKFHSDWSTALGTTEDRKS